MEDDVLRGINERLGARAGEITERLLEAVENGDAKPSAVLSGIKELKQIIEQLLEAFDPPRMEITVRMEDA